MEKIIHAKEIPRSPHDIPSSLLHASHGTHTIPALNRLDEDNDDNDDDGRSGLREKQTRPALRLRLDQARVFIWLSLRDALHDIV